MSKPTLLDEIADLKRELKMRQQVYANQRSRETDPRKVLAMKQGHDFQIACTEATIKRLESLVPQQTSLF